MRELLLLRLLCDIQSACQHKCPINCTLSSRRRGATLPCVTMVPSCNANMGNTIVIQPVYPIQTRWFSVSAPLEGNHVEHGGVLPPISQGLICALYYTLPPSCRHTCYLRGAVGRAKAKVLLLLLQLLLHHLVLADRVLTGLRVASRAGCVCSLS